MNVIFSYIWDTHIIICEISLKFNIKIRLHDQFQQTWRETLHNCHTTLSYRIVKETFILCLSSMYEEFEDTKGVIRISVYRRRTENTMVKGKGTKGQTTIYKSYI